MAAKSIEPGQPAQSAPADPARNLLHLVNFLHVQKPSSADSLTKCIVSEKTSITFSKLRFFKVRPGGSVVSMSDSRPGGSEFNPRLKRTFFPA